jgi:glycosyltransferase involved in cell wall biosynthesis
MTPRRVAYVIRAFPKLSETFIANELAEVRRRGVEVCILSLRPPVDEQCHEIVTQAKLLDLTTYDREKFPTVLRDFKPDLIHAHFATRATAVAQRLAAEFDVPFTFTAHRYDIYDKPPRDFAARAEAAAAVITVSQANRKYIVRNFGVAEQKLHIIPCGVDTKRFRPVERADCDGVPQIVCVARLARCKNHDLLLHAVAELQRRGLQFRCVLVGDGPRREEIEALRQSLGIASCVELVGAAEHAQVLSWWQQSSIAVLSSESEGMPVSLMEAGACGLPAVATAVGGVGELIVDGTTGLVVQPGDVSALADGIERLLTDQVLSARLGSAARARVKENYSLRQQVDSLLDVWMNALKRGTPTFVVPVTDPFGVANDADMPQLASALQPAEVQRQFGRRLPRLAGSDGYVEVRSIRAVRYKPAQRCLIEYEVEVERPNSDSENTVLLGKVRAGHSARAAFRLLDQLWNAGFDDDSSDFISVPEPLGVVNYFQMWLQRKVPGVAATELLPGPEGVQLACRVAEAAFKLHRSGVVPERRHTIADEMRILHQRVPKVVDLHPALAGRLTSILKAADRLAATIPNASVRTIHRDFYPDQVIIDGQRLYLIDFDLYCAGDPSLDIGNFLAHLTEQSLRTFSDPSTLRDVEAALEDRFVELAGEAVRSAIHAYSTLTLVRHIYLSTLKPERRPFTRQLVELCEERLQVSTSDREDYSVFTAAT